MLPSHYGWHPGWRMPAVQSPGPYMSAVPPSASSYYRPPPLPAPQVCCSEHAEHSYKLQKLEQEVDTLHSHVKSIFNYLCENELQSGQQRNVPEEVRASPSPPRKRKASRAEPEAKSTTEKRSKIIDDLEQKLADDRANNAKMEEKIVELRKQLQELRSRREEKERITKKLRPLPEQPAEAVNLEEVN